MSYFPNVKLSVVDVRDVAEAHVKALNLNINKSQRIIISCTSLWFE